MTKHVEPNPKRILFPGEPSAVINTSTDPDEPVKIGRQVQHIEPDEDDRPGLTLWVVFGYVAIICLIAAAVINWWIF